MKFTKTCFINASKRSTIGKTFAWQKNFNCHQLPDSPCQRQIWPVKSGAKLKPGFYSDMTLNFFSPSKLFANNGYLSCIDKPVLAQFTLIFQISVYYYHHTLIYEITLPRIFTTQLTDQYYPHSSELRYKWRKYWSIHRWILS